MLKTEERWAGQDESIGKWTQVRNRLECLWRDLVK